MQPCRRRIRQGALTVVIAAGIVAAAAPARAHEQPLPTETVVDAVELGVDGLDAEVVGSAADQLLLRNDGSATVEVLDADGDAFLRIGPRGVEANLGARAWYEGNDPYGLVRAGGRVREGTAPDRWRRVSVEPAWATFDHRLHPGNLDLPERIDEEVTLAEWSVPLRAGRERGEVRGRILARPVLGGHRPVMLTGPADERVVAQLVPGTVPGFFVRVLDDVTVVVLGAAGEPFLRVTRTGTDANLASPSWFEHARLAGIEPSTVPVDPTGPPVWAEVGDSDGFTWLDPRPMAASDGVPQDPTAAQVTGTWTVPIRVDAVDSLLAGETRWVPLPQPDTDHGTSWWLLAGLCVAAAGAGLVVVRVLPSRSRR